VLTKFLLNIGPASAYDEILASAERTDVEVAKANLARERERREKEFAERAVREAAIDDELRDRELAFRRSDELKRLRGQRGNPATTGRRWPMLPGQRDEPPATDGYREWPEDEAGGSTTTSSTGGDGERNGWRFRD
jgi:hypothetical protein